MDLFSQQDAEERARDASIPLAERCRPESLDDIIGHEKIIAPGMPLYESIRRNRLKSMLLWGPPGVGKTTLARVISREVNSDFISLSAVTSGVADVRKAIERALSNRKYFTRETILFIDEIHRFNKAQQDALLHVVENGTLVLIGATTENPSFEVISPLLSRCQVYQLASLEEAHIRRIVEQALKKDELFREKHIKTIDWDALYILAGGDARRALNAVEKAIDFLSDAPPPLTLDKAIFERIIQQKVLYYDKAGDYHYDLISAFIKSVRGSDPDAAVYWMARILDAGEDPKFVARRMIILASEDIGNADPQALQIAVSCFTAVTYIGMPECQIIMSQAATYLAAAPKSNAAYMAIRKATEDVRGKAEVTVPLHLRNAPTGLMKKLDYGKDYQYAHSFEDHFVRENYLPPELQGVIYYNPTEMGKEKPIRERLARLWAGVKQYSEEQKGDDKRKDAE